MYGLTSSTLATSSIGINSRVQSLRIPNQHLLIITSPLPILVIQGPTPRLDYTKYFSGELLCIPLSCSSSCPRKRTILSNSRRSRRSRARSMSRSVLSNNVYFPHLTQPPCRVNSSHLLIAFFLGSFFIASDVDRFPHLADDSKDTPATSADIKPTTHLNVALRNEFPFRKSSKYWS